MTKVLLVAGTSDAADFIANAPQSWQITATTVSQLGADAIKMNPNLTIEVGALDKKGFMNLMRRIAPDYIVDMSHPFATEATLNVKLAAEAENLPYLRFDRPEVALPGKITYFNDFPLAVQGLKKIEGNILLTIGSRNLHYFTELPDFYSRCYVRVLADSKILRQLEDMSIKPSHIFAMKGVASQALNIALAQEVKAQAIVTKDSGIKGGLLEKAAAAAALDIPLLIIKKPASDKKVYDSIAEIINYIEGRG